jgi:transcriptional regulator with XRE-family HTH domain
MVYQPKYEQSPEGRVLRQLRHAADLTQRQVAEMIDITPGFWGAIELGIWRASEKIIVDFCKAMGLPRSMEARLLALRAQEFHQPARERTPRVKVKRRVDQSILDSISVPGRKGKKSTDG